MKIIYAPDDRVLVYGYYKGTIIGQATPMILDIYNVQMDKKNLNGELIATVFCNDMEPI
jgi:hypothetical protein